LPYKDYLKRAEYAKNYYLKNKKQIKKNWKNWYLKNKEKEKGKKRIYYSKNKERILLNQKKHHEKNKLLLKKKHHLYYLKNKERILLSDKKYRKKNKLLIQKRTQNYYLKNIDKIKQKMKIYHKTPNFKITQQKYYQKYYHSLQGKLIYMKIIHKRRKLLKNNKYDLSVDKIKKAFMKSNGKCPYCFTPIYENSFSLDHIKPISKGGSNHLNNLIACCKPCNSKKRDSLLRNFKRLHLTPP